jgi:sugar phosphate isomerase/epimerase
MLNRSMRRRQFLFAAASSLAAAQVASGAPQARTDRSICVFTKPFQSLTYDELARHIAELGFDGIEAPIRVGGHIEPARVPDELPKMVEALRKRDLEVTVMTSSINDPNDPLTEPVLRTAAKLGIRRYRMQYFKYDLSKPILGQLDEWRRQFLDLAALNSEIGITAVYQNHAGRNYLGASLWDLGRLLEGIAVDQIGVAYDIRHATVEAGMSWPVTFHRIRPHIETVYVKDFHWVNGKPRNVPLGEGQISAEFFSMLAESKFDGPISLHEEYLDHRKPELVPQHLAAIRQDFATLKRLMR